MPFGKVHLISDFLDYNRAIRGQAIERVAVFVIIFHAEVVTHLSHLMSEIVIDEPAYATDK